MTAKKIPFSVNRNDVRPLFNQVVDGLREAIMSGFYVPGDKIPTSRELCSILGVSRIVTQAALEQLATEGLVVSRPRVGTIVRDRNEKQWRGRVVFVYENGDNNYLKTMLGSTMQDRLSDGGYIFSQASIGKHPDGTSDFCRLDAALSSSADLVMVMFHRPEIYAYLSNRKTPYAVFGEMNVRPSTAVGAIHLDYNLANDDFALRCKALGVKNVIEVYWHRLMCDVAPSLKKAGVHVKKLKVPVDESEGRLIGVRRAGRIAFERLIAEKRISRDAVYFIADDYLTTGALAALSYSGLKVPEDIRLVTFANAGLGPDYCRPLSRMELNSVCAGEATAAAILEFLKTGVFPAGITVGPKWMDGDTM